MDAFLVLVEKILEFDDVGDIKVLAFIIAVIFLHHLFFYKILVHINRKFFLNRGLVVLSTH